MSDQQPVFNIEKIYVKDASLGRRMHRRSSSSRRSRRWRVQLATAATRAGDGLYESSC